MTNPCTYWDERAATWSLVGEPLRPGDADISIMERMVCTAGSRGVKAPQAALLGVTPEILGMAWPPGTHILAFDMAPGMIRHLWPHRVLSNAAVLCSDWFSLPVIDGYFDVVVGDGVLTTLSFPGEYSDLARELHRVLVQDGIMVLRLYASPSVRETAEAVFQDLFAGRIRNLHAFKWRLAMAIQEDASVGVTHGEIWDSWHLNVPLPKELFQTLGWPLEEMATIDAYRGAYSTSCSFPSRDEVVELLSQLFDLVEVAEPSYDDGECYPTLLFRRR